MHRQFKPADHSKGDPNTIGGYAAVHDRPAAFEGRDGFSYSVELMAEPMNDSSGGWGAFFLFVKWARLGAQTPEGHVETPFLATAPSEAEARARLGALSLAEVKDLLDRAIVDARGAEPNRRWWDAMREEDETT